MSRRIQFDKWWTARRRIDFERWLAYAEWKLNYTLAIDKPYRKGPPDEQWTHGTLIPSPDAKIGVVIGTYGTPSYIALQLATRRRHWPSVPVLIHDDSSPDYPELTDLCLSNGVDITRTPERCGWSLGDLSALISGLDWASRNNIELLVKISRRFILNHAWTFGLQQLAYGSQYPTYGCCCGHFGFRLRSECVAMHVPSWQASGIVRDMREMVSDCRVIDGPIENWYQTTAYQVYLSQAPFTSRRFDYLFPRDPFWRGYAWWPVMGMSRLCRMPGVLWHDANSTEEYLDLARELGLGQYGLDDFIMPDFKDSVRTEAEVVRTRKAKVG
ncbi:MAG: hypothetical protein ACLQVD_05265 [Capsulimonadaceae bacterium]